MNWQDHIERRPGVMMGKPVIKGTRVTVELILERLGDGWGGEEILHAFPHLTREHLHAAQAYDADSLRTDEVVFLDG